MCVCVHVCVHMRTCVSIDVSGYGVLGVYINCRVTDSSEALYDKPSLTPCMGPQPSREACPIQLK